jgi:hypothetical protein
MDSTVNLVTLNEFNKRNELFIADSDIYNKNYFIIERNNNYEMIYYGSTLEKVIKMVYYILNPYVNLRIHPSDKKFQASLMQSKEEMQKSLPTLKEKFQLMLSGEERTEWLIKFTKLILENRQRFVLKGDENILVRNFIFLRPQESLQKVEESISKLDESIQALSKKYSNKEVSHLITEALQTRELLIQKKETIEMINLYEEYIDFEEMAFKHFKKEIKELYIQFTDEQSPHLQRLAACAGLLVRAEVLAQAADYGMDILEVDRPHISLPDLFESIQQYCKDFKSDQIFYSQVNLQTVQSVIDLHSVDHQRSLTLFYKVWGENRSTRSSSSNMKLAEQAAVALRDVYRNSHQERMIQQDLLKRNIASAEAICRNLDVECDKVREQIAEKEKEKGTLSAKLNEEREKESETILKTLDVLTFKKADTIKRFANNAFFGFYRLLAQIIDDSQSASSKKYFEEKTLSEEILRDVGFKNTKTLSLSNGAFFFNKEFQALVQQSKKLALDELRVHKFSLRQLQNAFKEQQKTIEKHAQFQNYREDYSSVSSQLTVKTKLLNDVCGNFIDPEEKLTVEMFEDRLNFIKEELEEIKTWTPGLLDYFDKEERIEENKRKIESLQKVLAIYDNAQIDAIKSLIEFRDLLEQKETLNQKLLAEKAKLRVNERVKTLMQYIDILNVLEDGFSLIEELVKARSVYPEHIDQTMQEIKELKKQLEDKEADLKEAIERKAELILLQDRFKDVR